ncbi:MAG: ComF family protein [Trueperaceae bacterium]
MPLDALIGALLCPICRADWSGSGGCCKSCRSRLVGSASKPGSVLSLDLPGLVALGYYRGDLAQAVRAYKFRGVRRLAAVFAQSLAAAIMARGWRPALVTYVPLHPSRRRRRGFDQARLLAVNVAGHLGLPCRSLLARTRLTPQQARLSAAQRRHNVRHAFRAVRAAPNRVLLIDDVFTTGATLGACREALEDAGARAVLLAVLAIAPRSNADRSGQGGSQGDQQTAGNPQ